MSSLHHANSICNIGLRALKSVLVSAGNIKRDRIQQLNQELAAQGQTLEETDLSKQLHKQEDEVRIMFEVQDLKFATLATVSCCGMVWFSEDVLTLDMVFDHFILKLKSMPIDEGEEELRGGGAPSIRRPFLLHNMQVQRDCADLLHSHFASDGMVPRCLEHPATLDHIMDFTRLRALNSLFSMFHQMIRNIVSYNQSHPDFPMLSDQLKAYVPCYFVSCLIWCFSRDGKMVYREKVGDFIIGTTTIPLPPGTAPIIDFEVNLQGEWVLWSNRVPKIEVETHKVGSPDVVVSTLNTVRHKSLLYTWLGEHKLMVLCGPPGSGKTMTLFSALHALPDIEVVGLNFSSATTPKLLLKMFNHYCQYKRTPNGVVMAPAHLRKWLVLFCDKINLPDFDKY
ncbi:PREDICTED: dynein heavy chain, cytoplasmic-like, partial [Amphimedon queenslandica]|uniref:Dynein heavy chain AAA 5 extension domain-containing protein n=1 Tax=Amphimedon queenslandica TaxID=400682 RepID=A0AAN0JR01_AMPQE